MANHQIFEPRSRFRGVGGWGIAGPYLDRWLSGISLMAKDHSGHDERSLALLPSGCIVVL